MDVHILTGEPTNRHGRPNNWADDTADELLAIFLNEGPIKAQAKWDEIQINQSPKQCDAIVAIGRFQNLVRQALTKTQGPTP